MRRFGLVAMSEGRPLLGIFDDEHVIREFIEISDPTNHYKDFDVNEVEVVELEGEADPDNVKEGFTLLSLAQYDISRDEDGVIPIDFIEGTFMNLLEDENELREYFNTMWDETIVEVLKYGEILENPVN